MKKTKKCDLMVIDNFLDPDDFSAVKQIFTNTSFPWYMNPGISDRFSTGSITNPLDNYYFTHLLYMNHQITSEHFESLAKIITPKIRETLVMNFRAYIRIKANMYIRTEKVQVHNWHIDGKEIADLQSGLLCLNTCDGYTGFIDGSEIDSVENRMIFFDANDKHHSTTCSNASQRLNININFV